MSASTPTSEADFGQTVGELRWMRNVVRTLKALAPVKTARWLKDQTGLSLRQCENICAETSGFSVATLRLLLRSEAGFEILQDFLCEETAPDPEWLLDLRYHYQSKQLQDEIADARQRLRQQKRLRRGHVALRT